MRAHTTGTGNDADLSCAATGVAPDYWYELTLPANNTLTLQVDAEFDSAIELTTGDCLNRTSPVCDDDSWFGKKSAIVDVALGAGTYCIVIDGVGAGPAIHQGRFDLFVSLASAIP
jgi:hypothetical protein